jgi:hypothetical protein
MFDSSCGLKSAMERERSAASRVRKKERERVAVSNPRGAYVIDSASNPALAIAHEIDASSCSLTQPYGGNKSTEMRLARTPCPVRAGVSFGCGCSWLVMVHC